MKAMKIETWFINRVGVFDKELRNLCSLWWPRVICTVATWWRVSMHNLLTNCCLICYRSYFNNPQEARNRQEGEPLIPVSIPITKNQQVIWLKKSKDVLGHKPSTFPPPELQKKNLCLQIINKWIEVLLVKTEVNLLEILRLQRSVRLFTEIHCDRPRGGGYILRQRKFWLCERKK